MLHSIDFSCDLWTWLWLGLITFIQRLKNATILETKCFQLQESQVSDVCGEGDKPQFWCFLLLSVNMDSNLSNISSIHQICPVTINPTTSFLIWKRYLSSRHFATDDDSIDAVVRFLEGQGSICYMSVVGRIKCINNGGYCIEKMTTKFSEIKSFAQAAKIFTCVLDQKWNRVRVMSIKKNNTKNFVERE